MVGVVVLVVFSFNANQNVGIWTEPSLRWYREVFRDEAGFASHQETPHFKALILGQALPKLAKRERTQHRFICQ